MAGWHHNYPNNHISESANLAPMLSILKKYNKLK